MPVEQAIQQKFIPALTGREIPGDMERDLFALLTQLGGLGITNPVEMSECQFDASKRITAPLMALVVQQEAFLGEVREEAEKTRQLIRSERRLEQAWATEHLRERLSPNFQRCMDLAKEKGGWIFMAGGITGPGTPVQLVEKRVPRRSMSSIWLDP